MELCRLIFLALVSCVLAEDPKVYFVEKFEDEAYTDRWVESTFKGSDAGKFKWSAGKFYNDAELDKGKPVVIFLTFDAS